MKPEQDKEIEAEIVEEIPLDLRSAGVPKAPQQSASIQGRVTDRMLIKAEEDRIKNLEERIKTRLSQIKGLKDEIKTCRTRIKLFEKAEAMAASVTEKKRSAPPVT